MIPQSIVRIVLLISLCMHLSACDLGTTKEEDDAGKVAVTTQALTQDQCLKAATDAYQASLKLRVPRFLADPPFQIAKLGCKLVISAPACVEELACVERGRVKFQDARKRGASLAELEKLVASTIEQCSSVCQEDEEEPSGTSCEDKALTQANVRLEAGAPKNEVEIAYQVAIAMCAGKHANPCEAAVEGRANVLNYRLTTALLLGKITPSEYIHGIRKNAQKLRESRKDPAFCKELERSDSDNDLVPDDRDKCPGSPEQTVTTEQGCPLDPKEQASEVAPDPESAQTYLQGMGIMVSKGCKDAPPPNTPTPLKIGIEYPSFVRPELHVRTTPVTNQPADCTVFYEISAVAKSPQPDFEGNSNPLYAHTTFRAAESRTSSGETDFVVESRTKPCPPGATCTLMLRYTFDLEPPGRRQLGNGALARDYVEWRVRAVNGAGKASPWSALTTTDVRPAPWP